MNITYKSGIIPPTSAIIELYRSAGLDRPLSDAERISKMYAHSNLVITAWHDRRLVGVSRSVTDFCYCCYLSDLAVRQEYKGAGIGKKLIELTKKTVGDDCNLVLLSAPSAMEFYPKAGLAKVQNGFMLQRTK